jgi:hypothetical protein
MIINAKVAVRQAWISKSKVAVVCEVIAAATAGGIWMN